jgi:hypothetical protein
MGGDSHGVEPGPPDPLNDLRSSERSPGDSVDLLPVGRYTCAMSSALRLMHSAARIFIRFWGPEKTDPNGDLAREAELQRMRSALN